MTAAEQAVVDYALAKGFLNKDQIQQARLQASQDPAGLLSVLASRYLRAEQVQELRKVYQQAQAPSPPPVRVDRGGATVSAAPGEPVGAPRINLPDAALGVPAPGERFGGYLIERELARGGMGAVFIARDPTLDRAVALKVMLGRSERAHERFVREAQATARLKHPNVVGVHDAGIHDDLPFLVMDLIEGESIRERVDKQGPLDEREAAAATKKIAEALASAHALGILHRDIKPDNILLDDREEPRLTDFGLASDEAAEGHSLTKTGQILGTPAYMPPEQARGQRSAIDARSDVYSLGATLYFMLTGRPPFERDSAMNTIVAAISQDPTPPSKLRKGLSGSLEAICLKCMQKASDARYPSAEALAQELERWLSGGAVGARRSRGSLALGLSVCTIVLVTLVVAQALRSDEDRPAPETISVVDSAEADAEPLTAKQVASAERELDRLAGVGDADKRRLSLESWLSKYAEHPRAEAARRLLSLAFLETPVRTFRHRDCRGVRLLAQTQRVLTFGSTRVLLWDLNSGAELGRWEFSEAVTSLAAKPSERGFACIVEETLYLVDLAGTATSIDAVSGRPRALSWSPSGRLLAVGTHSGGTKIVDAEGTPLWQLPGSESKVNVLAFADEKTLVVAEGESLEGNVLKKTRNNLRVWNLDQRDQPTQHIPFAGESSAVACSNDAKYFAAGIDGYRLALYSVAEEEPPRDFRAENPVEGSIFRSAHESPVRDVDFSDGGTRLASVSSNRIQKGGDEVRLWHVQSGAVLWKQLDYPELLRGVDLFPDGQQLLIASSVGAELWDLRGLREE